MTKRVTINAVNAEIARLGGKEILIRGEGYFYFAEGDAHLWDAESVYVFRLSHLTFEQWIKEWRSRRDEFARSQTSSCLEKS